MLRSGHLAERSRDRALETVERNARAQSQLIGDLLDVSRILSGKLKLEIERVSVAATVEAALESVRPAAEAKEIQLLSELEGAAQVMGDATRLQQVVWNLLANAVKFTPRGGRVQVSVVRREAMVEIAVVDSGQGIRQSFLPYVFERFRQADASPTRAHGGLGLGLSIVKHLVEAHGGVVFAHSDGEGKGATFRITLPTAARADESVELATLMRSAALSPRELLEPPKIDGLKVLVVDDEPDARALLQSLLEGFGATVQTAASATEALELFGTQRPDVLVSDLAMPGEDGFSLLRKLRAVHGKGGNVPAVALSAYTRSEDRTRALLAGFRAHVPKPIEPAELVAVLASLMPPVDAS
jgi:CheY-like chemotaxis protein